MDKGLDFEQAKRMAARMGMGVMAQEEAAEYFIKMYKLFTEKVNLIDGIKFWYLIRPSGHFLYHSSQLFLAVLFLTFRKKIIA